MSRQELGNISRKITHGGMSAITASASRHISGTKPAFNSILSSGSPYAMEQKNAAQMEKFSKFLQTGLGVDLEQIAADIPGTTPWALSIASEVERKKCEAYDYCMNVKQNMISERVNAGLDLLEKSWYEAVGGSTMFVVGAVTWQSGVGALGIPAGLFGIVSAISDASQAAQEIEYGLKGNATAVSSNFLRDSLFKGNDTIYNNTTNITAGAGVLIFTITYPILAGTTVILPGAANQNDGKPPASTPLLENNGVNEISSKASLSDLPENVQNSFNRYEKAGWQGNVSGQTPGTNAGRRWANRNSQLPTTDADGNPITYREFDVNNYNGINRDGERFIVGSDGSVWYTDSHYGEGTSLNGIADFVQIK